MELNLQLEIKSRIKHTLQKRKIQYPKREKASNQKDAILKK